MRLKRPAAVLEPEKAFGSKILKKLHARLKGIVEKAREKLLQGEPKEQVKLWAKEQAG